MESCLLVCHKNKPKERKGKIIFIDAKDEIRLEQSTAYLKEEHINKIADAYRNFQDTEGFAKVVGKDEVLQENNGNLSVQFYVKSSKEENEHQIKDLLDEIKRGQSWITDSIENLFIKLDSIGIRNLIDDFVSGTPKFGNLLEGKKLTKVRFADVAVKMTRRIDPLNADIERIVGGENLESEDFKIRSWGIIGRDFLGPAFHILFKKGDILYGSRRTYLRKVALADFDGVCANTTYVIRAKEEILLQGLLKHIMLSESFTQYSIGVSKGSTNPYINWKDLDNFTFQIPDIETQKETVSILDEILEIAEQTREQKQTLKNLKFKLLNEILG